MNHLISVSQSSSGSSMNKVPLHMVHKVSSSTTGGSNLHGQVLSVKPSIHTMAASSATSAGQATPMFKINTCKNSKTFSWSYFIYVIYVIMCGSLFIKTGINFHWNNTLISEHFLKNNF